MPEELTYRLTGQQQYPEDYESRDDDKFNYRYRGETRAGLLNDAPVLTAHLQVANLTGTSSCGWSPSSWSWNGKKIFLSSDIR
jgi:hypothetical protein